MKKILLLLLSISLLAFTLKIPTNASTDDSINLIDPQAFLTIDTTPLNGQWAKLEISESGFLAIKSGIEYFFLPTYINKLTQLPANHWSMLPLFTNAPSIKLYNDENILIDTITLSKELISEGMLSGYAFSVPTGVTKIKFQNVSLTSTLLSANSFELFYENECMGIDGALLLIEADKIKYLPSAYNFNYNDIRHMPSYDISDLYLGEDLAYYFYGNTYLDNLYPVLEANQYKYKTNVDNPISLEELKSCLQISAYDEIDGNITHKITATSPQYLLEVYGVSNVKNRLLGSYNVEFSVSDNAGNISKMDVELIVEDNTRPVLNMATSILTYENEVTNEAISLTQIINNLHVEDNYSSVTIKETINGYLGNEHKLGTFPIEFIYEDSSNNRLSVTVTITNVDTQAPIISMSTNSIDVSYTSKEGLSSLLNKLDIEVNDSFDGDLNYSVVLDNYTNNARYVGLYTVKIRAIDSSGNSSEKTINIQVVDDVAPLFYINNNVIIVKIGTMYKESEITKLLIQRGLSHDSSFIIEVISDDYTPNYNTAGEYIMKLNIKYESGYSQSQTLIFRVVNNNSNNRISFFAKVWALIKKIFQWLWNIIKWPFEKLAALF